MATTGTSSTGTKIKIVLGFIISIAAIFIAGYFAYNSFTRLLDSVKTLSTPDESVNILQDIQNDMIEGENSMQTYTTSPTDEALAEYELKMSDIHDEFDKLRNLPTFQLLRESDIDTLLALFNERDNLV